MGKPVDIETLDVHLKYGLISANILVTIFAICGNAVAIVVAFKSRWTSSPTKMCLISFSLCDLFLTITSTPVDLDQLMDSLHAWHLGDFLCKFLPFAQFMFLLANSFSLLAMILQRYWSTSILLASRIYNRAENSSKIMTAIVFSFIWLIPFGFSVPYLFAYSLNHFNCTTTGNFTHILKLPTLDMYVKTEIESTTDESTGTTGVDLEDGFLNNNKPVRTTHCFLLNASDSNSDWISFMEPSNETSVKTRMNVMNSVISSWDFDSGENTTLISISRLISICQQTREAHVALYHVATGILFLVVIIAYFWGFNYFRRMKTVLETFERSLVPNQSTGATSSTAMPSSSALASRTSLRSNITDAEVRNFQLLTEIRKMLARQKRGIKLIQHIILIYVICRMPIWIYTVINEINVYTRSRTMLGIYFSLHLLANVKGAITPFLYAHASQSMRSTDFKYSVGRGSSSNGNAKDKFGVSLRHRSTVSNLSELSVASASTATASTATTVPSIINTDNRMIVHESISSNNLQFRSAMKMTQPIEILNYLPCSCLFAPRKNSSTYILEDP